MYCMWVFLKAMDSDTFTIHTGWMIRKIQKLQQTTKKEHNIYTIIAFCYRPRRKKEIHFSGSEFGLHQSKWVCATAAAAAYVWEWCWHGCLWASIESWIVKRKKNCGSKTKTKRRNEFYTEHMHRMYMVWHRMYKIIDILCVHRMTENDFASMCRTHINFGCRKQMESTAMETYWSHTHTRSHLNSTHSFSTVYGLSSFSL